MHPLALLVVILLLQTLAIGILLLIQPRISRRGLLFGVYVGEDRWSGDEARAITSRWTRDILAAMVATPLLGLAVAATAPSSPGRVTGGAVLSILLLSLVSYAEYLRAHLQARRLAVPGAPAAAALVGELPHSLVVPGASLVFASLSGIAIVAYAALHYSEMPLQIPTHFGFSGAPDAWSPRSFGSVMALPLGAMLMGISLAAIACLTARAKRAIRVGDGGVSLSAQLQFRNVTALFLSGVAILVSAMMCSMAYYSVRTSLGLASGLPWYSTVLTGILLVYAIGGSLFLAFRYGQGGARLERTAGAAPLANGLADNSHWVLGMFYVNRDDPSFMVEKRFGVGYTLNFGNRKAVALFVVFLGFILFMVVSGLTMQQSSGPVK